MISIAILILLVPRVTQAQYPQVKTAKLFRTWISLEGGGKKSGILYEVRDSSIILSDSRKKTDYTESGNYHLTKLNVRDITVIRMRKNNAVRRGIMIGGLSGAFVGGLIGLTSTNTVKNKTASAGLTISAVIFSSIFVGTCGAIIGAAFSPIRSHVNIHGSLHKFDKNRDNLARRSITWDPEMTGEKHTSFAYLRDSLVDGDGNRYPLVALGTMVFMAENLKVTHFRNGKKIPDVKDADGWRKADRPARCNLRDDSTNVAAYGRLYNGYAITDTAAICPVGWHIPGYDEWSSLILCLGGKEFAGGYLKETGTAHWNAPNYTLLTGNTFALPGGNRNPNGGFSETGHICQWWIAKEKEEPGFRALSLGNENTGIVTINPDKNSGLSIRCLRNN